MTSPNPGTRQWYDQVQEPIIDPDRPIIDPHHHLWRNRGFDYLLEDLWRDTQSGHNIQKTVFIECSAEYDTNAEDAMQPVGETRFVAEIAAESDLGEGPSIAAIISHANLQLGDRLEAVLEAHAEAGQGRFRGIRHAGSRDDSGAPLLIPGRAIPNLYAQADFRQGMKKLGELGYTYDTWHYHHQNPAFGELAKAVEGTTMILDHFGTPLGVGHYAEKKADIFTQWKKDIAKIAEYPNVIAKLGGMAMPDNGYGWHQRAKPPTSDEFVEAQKDYYLHTIDCFGPERCMFESNFPVDRFSLSYSILYNGFKKIVANFTENEKQQMFYATAARVYQIGD